MTITQTIVPANRLGQLLAENRQRVGVDLESIANRSAFTVGELADIEAGHRVLDDNLITEVTNLYAVQTGQIVPTRAELVVDVEQHQITASGQSVDLKSVTTDHILDRYLSLIYVLRNKVPGTKIPLRDKDLGILSNSLEMDRALIVESLQSSMEGDPEAVRGLVQWFRNRLWVPGTGIFVGAVSVGSLVMLTANPAAATDDSVALPEPEPDPESQASIATVRIEAPATDPVAEPTPLGDLATVDLSDAPAEVIAVENVEPAAEETASVNEQSAQVARDELGRQAEDLIAFDLAAALPGWDISYQEARPDHRGLTFPYEKTIEIYVRDSDTAASIAKIVAHEAGHAVDVELLTDTDRWAWLKARSTMNAQWWPTAYGADFTTGAGDFAEAFAYLTTGAPSVSEIGGPVTAEDLRVLQGILDRAMA